MRKRGLCYHPLSVCLSVTRRYCIEKDKDIIKLFSRPWAPPLWLSNTTYGCEILTGRGACHSGGLRSFFSVWKRLTMAVLEIKRPLIVHRSPMKVVQLIRNWGLAVWDSKYVIILHPPFTGHVLPLMRIANFAIFDWNRRLSRKRYEIGPWHHCDNGNDNWSRRICTDVTHLVFLSQIGSHVWRIDPCRFRWSWVTPNPGFKVTV